jgi:putative ABC transport system permease protein
MPSDGTKVVIFELSHLPPAFLLVLFAIALSYFYNLKAERDLLESSLRTTIQLLLLGYLLRFILEVQSLALLIFILFVMSLFGSITVVERLKIEGSFGRLFLKSYIALVIPSSLVFVLLYLMDYVHKDPVSMITLWGLVLGNSLSNVSLTFERMRSEAFNRIREIEAKIALGAPLKKAMEEVVQNAIKVSMMPKYNMLRSAGIVHIPGVAVGMMVGGADPISAVVFQIVVMIVLLTVSFFTSLITAALTYSSVLG